MSHPFSIAENRHHLLLAEAHQVNEFLDARLFAAEVPEDQRLAVAESVLTLALQAREYGVIDALNFFPDLRPAFVSCCATCRQPKPNKTIWPLALVLPSDASSGDRRRKP